MLVDRGGDRVCDESRYGAALGDAIVRRGGQAWLLTDRATLAEARRQSARVDAVVPAAAGVVPADRRRVSAPTVAAVAARACGGTPPGSRPPWPPMPRRATRPCPTRPESPPPACGRRTSRRSRSIDCSVRPRLFYPAPVLTLGGLVVSPASGQVLRADGSPVDGLYAAGRSAAGLCSRSYVSGLSLADCVSAAAPATTPRSSRRFREPKQTTDH